MSDSDELNEHALAAMNKLSDELGLAAGLVSVGIDFANPDTIVVRHLAGAARFDLPRYVEINGDRYGVRTEVSPAVGPAIAPISELPEQAAGPPFMGGDAVRSSRDRNHYGTVGLFADITYDYKGRRTYTCASTRALLSCNHVIAVSDTGERGDVLLRADGNRFGALRCFVPMLDPLVHVDVALGTYDAGLDVTRLTVRQWGKIRGIRSPKYRNEVIRKYGATTQATEGVIESIDNLRIGSKTFRGVWRTSPGFGCRGDSGSLVMGDDRKATGVYSWGEVRPCSDGPRGYFWGFADPKKLGAVLGLEAVSE